MSTLEFSQLLGNYGEFVSRARREPAGTGERRFYLLGFECGGLGTPADRIHRRLARADIGIRHQRARWGSGFRLCGSQIPFLRRRNRVYGDRGTHHRSGLAQSA